MIVERIIAKINNLKYFPRGVHPPTFKSPSRDRAIEPVPWPDQVIIPLQQHIGAPAKPAVEPRQQVKRGDVLGTSGGFVSAAVHSSVDGTTAAATTVLLPTARRTLAVPVKCTSPSNEVLQDHLQQYLTSDEGIASVDQIDPKQIVESAQQAGLVGMGGATFPTHVKLMVGPDRKIDTVVINGSECEPYLTADERLMREAPGLIVRGLLLAVRATGAERGVVAIENNKPEAIDAMRSAIDGMDNVELAVCMTQYPMGGERSLVPAVLDRVVPTGGLPLDVGAVVLNVATAVSLAHAVDRSRPLTDRIVTVTGAVERPGNFFVPIGTPIGWVIDQAGGLRGDAVEIIMGGPMMGVAMPDLSVPVIKGTSGLTALTAADVARRKETACVKCGRCVDHCPLRLSATRIAHAVKHGNLELAQRYDLMACVECGCCAYVCPARIPLVQYMKSGKAEVMRRRAREKAKAG